MSRAKDIVSTLFPSGKSTQSLILSESRKSLPSAREEFVGICLMAHIPDKLILRGIETVMEGDG